MGNGRCIKFTIGSLLIIGGIGMIVIAGLVAKDMCDFRKSEGVKIGGDIAKAIGLDRPEALKNHDAMLAAACLAAIAVLIQIILAIFILIKGLKSLCVKVTLIIIAIFYAVALILKVVMPVDKFYNDDNMKIKLVSFLALVCFNLALAIIGFIMSFF